MTALEVPLILELAVLELVRAGGGQAGWYWLAMRHPRPGVPLIPDMMKVVRELRARGHLTSHEASPGKEVWGLAPAGEARLAELTRGPLALAELAPLLEALHAGGVAAWRALVPLTADVARLREVLHQVLAFDLGLAEQVVEGLGEDELAALAADPRPVVREALARYRARGGR